MQFILIPGVLFLALLLLWDGLTAPQASEPHSIGVCPCGNCVSLPEFV